MTVLRTMPDTYSTRDATMSTLTPMPTTPTTPTSRLHTEFRRLYLCAGTAPATSPGTASDAGLVDPQGRVRALVLELGRPADWDRLGAVWRGVQTDLGLPAPGIAASGTDALQLWFSLVEPLPVDAAQDALDLLRRRWLVDLPAGRVTLWPQPSGAGVGAPTRHARAVPALNEATGNWSAFVAPDLAPLFADTPWLDIPPGDDGQAGVLGALASISPHAWATALERLRSQVSVQTVQTMQSAQAMPDQTPPATPAPAPIHLGTTAHTEPRAFLLAVMNDGSVPLALRIEAARALLGSA
jgi:hypothetical protein